MLRYTLKRLLYMVISLFIIVTITFFLMKLMPGSPFNDEKLSEQQKTILNEKYGLNDPLPVQYGNYMKNVVKEILETHSNMITNLFGILLNRD